MDMRHEKFTNTTWEPYNIAMEDHLHVHGHDDDQPPFDQTQPQTQTQSWPKPNNYYRYSLPILNPNNHPSILPSQNLVNAAQTGDLMKGEELIEEDLQEEEEEEEEEEELGAMKEMMFKIAAMQPVDIDPATIRRPRRRNVRISDDPQSVAARHRRERISEKIRILQRLVPGGTKMDTASMLDEAIRYVKFLKRQIRILQSNHHLQPPTAQDLTAAAPPGTSSSYLFNINDGAGDEYPMCFNRRFIGHH